MNRIALIDVAVLATAGSIGLAGACYLPPALWPAQFPVLHPLEQPWSDEYLHEPVGPPVPTESVVWYPITTTKVIEAGAEGGIVFAEQEGD